MRYCVSCGLSVEEKWSFCPNCGSSKVPEKESNPVSKNVTESKAPHNQNQIIVEKNSESINTILGVVALIGMAFILFAIDKGADWRDIADARDDCRKSEEELEDLGIELSSSLCSVYASEADELLFETCISAVIGILIIFIVSGQLDQPSSQLEYPSSQQLRDDRAKRHLQQITKKNPRWRSSAPVSREMEKTLERNTRSNPIRCKHFFKDGPDLRCSNTHLNKMYCDEHIEKLESRTK